MSELSNFDIVELVNKWNKDREDREWKNEPKFIGFLDFLLPYVKQRKVVDSDEFFYKEEECKPLTANEFEWLLDSLCEKVVSYSRQNYIENPTLYDDYNESDYIRIKDDVYKVEIIHGQGSFSRFSLVEDLNEDLYDIIDYDIMMKGELSPNYSHNLEKQLFKNIESIRMKFKLDEDEFKKFLEKYIDR